MAVFEMFTAFRLTRAAKRLPIAASKVNTAVAAVKTASHVSTVQLPTYFFSPVPPPLPCCDVGGIGLLPFSLVVLRELIDIFSPLGRAVPELPFPFPVWFFELIFSSIFDAGALVFLAFFGLRLRLRLLRQFRSAHGILSNPAGLAVAASALSLASFCHQRILSSLPPVAIANSGFP